MADNVAITAGSGTTIATDDVGGVQYQRVKVSHGADGAATDTSNANPLPVGGTITAFPDNEAPALLTRNLGQQIWNVSFSEVGANVISTQLTTPIIGTGITYSQASGGLAIVMNTTANREFLTRSTQTWRGSLRARVSTVLSQRIANNNFAVLLADLIGEGLTYNIVNTTTVDVTKTSHGFTAQNVGQFMLIGGITGAAGVPGRWAIASIPDANTIRFTVAGYPASGTGTLTLFGHSYIRNLYTGITATNSSFDAQRRGWAGGDTTATINTTASPGHIGIFEVTGREVYFLDQLRASTTTPAATLRGNKIENLPDDNQDLYLFLWAYNGTTNPASNTTWTISFASVEKFANHPVYIQGVRSNGVTNPLAVIFPSAQAVSGTVTANIGTGSLAAGTNAIGDVGLQVRANATGAASIRHIVSVAGTNATNAKATAGRLLGYQFLNRGTGQVFVKFHNSATAPTAGAGVVMSVGIQPNTSVSFAFAPGIGFSAGIGFTIVTGALDTDNTGVGAGDVVGDFFFA